MRKNRALAAALVGLYYASLLASTTTGTMLLHNLTTLGDVSLVDFSLEDEADGSGQDWINGRAPRFPFF